MPELSLLDPPPRPTRGGFSLDAPSAAALALAHPAAAAIIVPHIVARLAD